jgi:hypothetical protein
MWEILTRERPFGNLTVEAMQRVNPEMGLEDGLAAKHGKSVGQIDMKSRNGMMHHNFQLTSKYIPILSWG